ncbi:MAG TPA: hypothetical protein VF181_07265 [Balneolaceae bacterium]
MERENDVNPVSKKSEKVYEPTPVVRDDHAEGLLARTIEQQTAKLPSDFFLWCSLGSMGLSLYLELTDRPRGSRFIGMWAPSLLIMGIYDKLIKLEGSR